MSDQDQKSYINYDDRERECTDCHKIFKFSELNKQNDGRPESMCKGCERKYQAKCRAKKNPDKYNECPYCKGSINIKNFIKDRTNVLAETIRKRYLQKVTELTLKENEIKQLKERIEELENHCTCNKYYKG